jgi:hypothetical protein
LGKIIGVYAGRPFEGWLHEEIVERLGDIRYYANEKVGEYNRAKKGIDFTPPLIVTDDDIAGTLTFLRALPDYHNNRDIDAAEIGQTWLNYIVENRTVFWWGGMGNSTEHTAYLRLKQGIKAPESGSTKTNGPVVAEQIGSQIFIDGWAMIAPGDPEYAADLARRAASVSHDGEAIYGAQVIAAMEAQAFVESDLNALIDVGVSFIPKDSLIYRVVADVREWHSSIADWKAAFRKIKEKYGYDKFPGNVHIVPNHAVVMLGLLYGDDDFGKSMLVANTAGWDTDCNAGNVGCIMGIKNGLAGLAATPSWREPVADRILISSADGGGAITDAVIEAQRIVNVGRSIAGEKPLAPKTGARFNFEFPGSTQGFASANSAAKIENVAGHSATGARSLAMRYTGTGAMETPTFIIPSELDMPGYQLLASPTLYPGQTVRASVQSAIATSARLFIRVYADGDATVTKYGEEVTVAPGKTAILTLRVPESGGNPVVTVGIEAHAGGENVLNLDYLSWDGEPSVTFARPANAETKGGEAWRRAWVLGVDQWESHWRQAYRLAQNRGRGLLIQGTREWHDYETETTIKISMAKAAGIAARVQGMERYYALLACDDGYLRLIKRQDGETILGETPFNGEGEKAHQFKLRVKGARIAAWIDGRQVFDIEDANDPLTGGAIAFVIEEGHIISDAISVR